MQDVKNLDTVSNTVSVLEEVNSDLTSIFDSENGPSTFFVTRSEYLQLFTSLAMNLHFTNTVRFVKNNKLGKTLFSEEVSTSSTKIAEFKRQIISSIHEKSEELISYNELLISADNKLVEILNLLDSSDKSSFYLKTYVKNDIYRVASLTFAINETRNLIIRPTIKVVEEEIEAGNKVIEALTSIKKGNRENYNPDVLARFCELLAMGLDSPDLFESIRELVKNNELNRELVNLRPYSVMEQREIRNKNRSAFHR